MTKLNEATLMVNGEVVETVKLSNPCQMWKAVYAWFDKYGDNLRAIVPDSEGNPFKDFTAKRRSDGKRVLINSVKETNRAFIKAHRTAAPTVDPLDAIADQAVENDNSDRAAYLPTAAEVFGEQPESRPGIEAGFKALVKPAKKAKPTKKAKKAEPAEQAEPAEPTEQA